LFVDLLNNFWKELDEIFESPQLISATGMLRLASDCHDE